MNLQDYVRWRGDLTLAERPFNVVDNLVLCALSYLDLGGIVPGPRDGSALTVADAAALAATRPVRVDGPEDRRLRVAPPELLADLGSSARFRGALLSGYVDIVDLAAGMQFSALTVGLDDGTTYVAFRGTDNTILGWRENFTMSYQVMPAQREAAEYLHAQASLARGPLRVGGHSKGGNLAVYAAMLLSEPEQDAILRVYSNDGPGLSPDVVDIVGLGRLSGRITSIVPEFAVIGMLFRDQDPSHVVVSDGRGVVQHNLMTWQVEGTGLREAGEISARAQLANRVLDLYLEEADDQDRRSFTDALFGALGAGGATLIVDVGHSDFGSFESVLFGLARSRHRARRSFGLWFRAAGRAIAAADWSAVPAQREFRRAVILIGFGVFFILVPALSVQILGSMAVLVLGCLAALRLARFFQKQRSAGRRRWLWLITFGLVAAALLAVLSQLHLLVVPTNLLFAMGLLANAWSSTSRGVRALKRSRRRTRGTLLVVSAAVSLLLGIVAVSTAGQVLPLFVLQAGQYCLVAGLLELFLTLRDEASGELTRQAVAADLLEDVGSRG